METIIFNHNINKDIILSALSIVKDFIKDRNLILTGGMAIDFMMRSKKLKLYEDDKLPDYDFFSPNFHKDAYDLGTILHNLQFQNINIIRGRHTSTMRIRLNKDSVADITYIPKNIYDKLPTVTYEGFRVIHPHYQVIDQHMSLYNPLSNPPYENFKDRWKKDMERYSLIIYNFPIEEKLYKSNKMITYKLPIELLKGNCLSGIHSIIYWLTYAKMLGYESKIKYEVSDSFEVSIPDDNIPISILSLNIETHIDKINNVKYFNPLLDKIETSLSGTYENLPVEFLDTFGKRIPSKKIEYDNKEFYISGLQKSLSLILSKEIFKLGHEELFNNIYMESLNIINWACGEFKLTKNKNLFWLLPMIDDLFGDVAIDDPYIELVKDIKIKISKQKPEPRFPPNVYNFPILETHYNFDPTINYKIDGSEISKEEFLELINKKRS